MLFWIFSVTNFVWPRGSLYIWTYWQEASMSSSSSSFFSCFCVYFCNEFSMANVLTVCSIHYTFSFFFFAYSGRSFHSATWITANIKTHRTLNKRWCDNEFLVSKSERDDTQEHGVSGDCLFCTRAHGFVCVCGCVCVCDGCVCVCVYVCTSGNVHHTRLNVYYDDGLYNETIEMANGLCSCQCLISFPWKNSTFSGWLYLPSTQHSIPTQLLIFFLLLFSLYLSLSLAFPHYLVFSSFFFSFAGLVGATKSFETQTWWLSSEWNSCQTEQKQQCCCCSNTKCCLMFNCSFNKQFSFE